MSEAPRVSPETYDTWLALLADERRRRLLLELAGSSPSEGGLSVPEDIVNPNEDPVTLSVQLRHVHLPKLADSNLIDWNRDADVVSPGLAFDRIRPLIRAIRSLDGAGVVRN
ncbi:ArsR family transcriptional regulator [Halobaculum halobium]|uniref:ArsR family transcriptional regulator n=1 Tax=Halobaculum halobium TaxID=3032281 RepID=A0ABD5TDS7_9EURY|nr:hypothetical protein [Halobaculum sp. SYNS20]